MRTVLSVVDSVEELFPISDVHRHGKMIRMWRSPSSGRWDDEAIPHHTQSLAVDATFRNVPARTNTVVNEATQRPACVETSLSLRIFGLCRSSIDADANPAAQLRHWTDLTKQVMVSLSRNTSNLRDVLISISIPNLFLPLPEFGMLLGNPTIRILRLQSANFPAIDTMVSTQERDALDAAIVANTTIQRVELRWSQRTDFPERLLYTWGRHSHLTELALDCDASNAHVTQDQMTALVTLLSTTKTLETLQLVFSFHTKEPMDSLVQGLQANTTLQTLLLRCGRLSADAMASWMAYLHTPKDTERHTLRKVGLSDDDYVFPTGTNFGTIAMDMVCRPLIENMVDPTAPITISPPTIGSSIRILELSGSVDRAHLFNALSTKEHARRFRLFHLKFGYFHTGSCDRLAHCLPSLVHVRRVTFPTDFVYPAVHMEALVRAMKQNGSLTRLTANFGTVEQCPSAELYQRLIQAYGERNAMLRKLLAQRLAIPGESVPTVNAKDGIVATGSKGEENPTLNVYPYLFQAALPAVVTAPNLLLTGLISLGEMVGDDSKVAL